MSGSVAPPGHPSRLNQPQQEHEEATVSALMSTYVGETATNLKESLEGIYAQTVPLDQLVLVSDGPVDVGQEEVNGLARAMNAGLERCSGKYIMCADSDDICDPRRLEVQLDYFQAHAETDVVAGWSTEFCDDGRPEMLKASPVHHDAVARALRWRNVLVHSTVLIRTETLRRIGGYRPDFGMLEDYELFVRLVQRGAIFHVIPKALLRFRVTTEQRCRRGGLRYCLNEIRFRFSCLRLGFLNTTEFFVVTLMYVIFRLIGGSFRDRLYAFVRTPPVE